MEKVYLGDSVYFDFDGYDIMLTTENGYGATNTIVLEPVVYRNLVEAVTRLQEKNK